MSRAEDIFQKLIYFGEEAIDEFIVNSQSEELFWTLSRLIHWEKTEILYTKMIAAIWQNVFQVSATRKAGLLCGVWSALAMWK